MSEFKDKVVVITGGASGIGKCIAEEFGRQGAIVEIIDKAPGDHYVGDISDKKVLEDFADGVIKKHDRIDILVNNALPLMKGIDECTYEEFEYALAVSLSGKVRVNSVSPGWIDTSYKVYEGSDAVQQPAGRVGNPMDIANTVLFLCSEKAGFITGENICVDGGMTKVMIYHGDNGWNLEI